MINVASGLIDVMKQAGLDAVENSKPVNLVFGTVTGVNPLVIQITPNLIIYENAGQIKVARQCTDYETSITLLSPWITSESGGGSGEAAYESHTHQVTGQHRIKIHNGLKTGDYVIMGRVQGGQQYIVFDKVGDGS